MILIEIKTLLLFKSLRTEYKKYIANVINELIFITNFFLLSFSFISDILVILTISLVSYSSYTYLPHYTLRLYEHLNKFDLNNR